jgi:hypothetical protein
MGKGSARRPDPRLCFACLEPHDRATVRRWAEILGLRWYDVPPLLQVVEMVGVLLLSADMDLPAGDAVRASAEALGLADDPARSTHPGDRFARTLGNWHRAAGGKSFQPRRSDVA